MVQLYDCPIFQLTNKHCSPDSRFNKHNKYIDVPGDWLHGASVAEHTLLPHETIMITLL